MDEDYVIEKPWVRWRRRLVIGVLLLGVVALAWGFEAVYDEWRASTGPSAWFMVKTFPARRSAREDIIGEGYQTQRECEEALKALSKTAGVALPGCQRLLLTDAAKIAGHPGALAPVSQ